MLAAPVSLIGRSEELRDARLHEARDAEKAEAASQAQSLANELINSRTPLTSARARDFRQQLQQFVRARDQDALLTAKQMRDVLTPMLDQLRAEHLCDLQVCADALTQTPEEAQLEQQLQAQPQPQPTGDDSLVEDPNDPNAILRDASDDGGTGGSTFSFSGGTGRGAPTDGNPGAPTARLPQPPTGSPQPQFPSAQPQPPTGAPLPMPRPPTPRGTGGSTLVATGNPEDAQIPTPGAPPVVAGATFVPAAVPGDSGTPRPRVVIPDVGQLPNGTTVEDYHQAQMLACETKADFANLLSTTAGQVAAFVHTAATHSETIGARMRAVATRSRPAGPAKGAGGSGSGSGSVSGGDDLDRLCAIGRKRDFRGFDKF
jgi:hypothetical protein